MNYLYPLVAIHISGYTELLYTREDVYAFINKYGQFYEKHKYWYSRYIGYDKYPRYEHVEGTHPWIVRDDRGRVVKYDDVCYKHRPYSGWNERNAKIRAIAAKGLPIPGTGGYRKCWKMNHTAKKNSGAGHRNRNRAKAIYEAEEYGIKNDVGYRVISWENY
jgi:hypothetical protein